MKRYAVTFGLFGFLAADVVGLMAGLPIVTTIARAVLFGAGFAVLGALLGKVVQLQMQELDVEEKERKLLAAGESTVPEEVYGMLSEQLGGPTKVASESASESPEGEEPASGEVGPAEGAATDAAATQSETGEEAPAGGESTPADLARAAHAEDIARALQALMKDGGAREGSKETEISGEAGGSADRRESTEAVAATDGSVAPSEQRGTASTVVE